MFRLGINMFGEYSKVFFGIKLLVFDFIRQHEKECLKFVKKIIVKNAKTIPSNKDWVDEQFQTNSWLCFQLDVGVQIWIVELETCTSKRKKMDIFQNYLLERLCPSVCKVLNIFH